MNPFERRQGIDIVIFILYLHLCIILQCFMFILFQSSNNKEKGKITKTPRKFQNGKSLIKWQNQKIIHIKRMNNNCQIPNLVQAFSDVENGSLNLVL